LEQPSSFFLLAGLPIGGPVSFWDFNPLTGKGISETLILFSKHT
jgi:hypothetical protein